MVEYVPNRGDIVWLDFDPQKGREIKKKRPALVVTPKKYNKKAGLAIFMSITSQIKGYPFEVLIQLEDINGAVLVDQVRSLDWKARRAQRIATVSSRVLEEILLRFRLLIQI